MMRVVGCILPVGNEVGLRHETIKFSDVFYSFLIQIFIDCHIFSKIYFQSYLHSSNPFVFFLFILGLIICLSWNIFNLLFLTNSCSVFTFCCLDCFPDELDRCYFYFGLIICLVNASIFSVIYGCLY